MSTTYVKNKKTISELKVKIAQEESLKNDLSEKKEMLSERYEDIENPEEIEKIAREILNLRKEGEEVYRIVK
jgi:cell division protein FtsB